jgi:hypothetical protein
MYIGYLRDRQELGFSCIKDIHAVKQLSDFKSTLKNPVTWIIRKSKQTVILIFSKEVLVAVFIFLKSSYIEPNVDHPSFVSSEVYESCVIKSDNLKFLTSPPQISDFILKLKGGSDEFTIEEQEKLVKSILAKAPQSSYQEISINKFLGKILKLIDPVISDQRFWRIISESQKPIKSELSDASEVRSTDILAPSENGKANQAKTGSKGSSIFVEALVTPQPRRKHTSLPPMKKTRLNMVTEGNFSEGLTPSGLSRNHEELSENIQLIEKLTRFRRAEPLYSSEALGESFKYGQKQLERKALSHLQKDFGVSSEGKTIEEMAAEYHDCIENLLQHPNLIVRKDGTLSKQEPTINIGDRKSRKIVSFENNPLYDKNHFISSYEITPEAFDDFEATGNIGLSPAEKKIKTDKLQKKLAQMQKEAANTNSFRSSLSEDARMSNSQLREVEMLQEQLKIDSNFQLTDKDKSLIQRAEKYKHHKNQFNQNNPDPDIARDEL